jgi:hypothetical protein
MPIGATMFAEIETGGKFSPPYQYWGEGVGSAGRRGSPSIRQNTAAGLNRTFSLFIDSPATNLI